MSEGSLTDNIFLLDERIVNGIKHFVAGSVGGMLDPDS